MLPRLWTGRTGVGGTGGGSGACRRPRNISSSNRSHRWGRGLHSTTTRPSSSSSSSLWESSSLMSSSASVSFHAKYYHQHAALGSLTRRSVSSHHHSNPNDNDDATATAAATATRLSGRNTRTTKTNTTTMVDYYQLFGYDTTPSATTTSESDRREDESHPFELNLPDLKQRYLTLMLEYHPDKLGLQPPPHDEEAPDTTTTPPTTPITADVITQAYHILQHPHTRAEHLLDVLYQRPLLDEENRKNATTTTTTTEEEHEEDEADPTTQSLVGMEFLMTMLEYRERIEDIVTGVHPTTTTTTTTTAEKEEEYPTHTHKKKQQQHQQELLRTLADETKVLQHKCEAVLANVFRETTTTAATAAATPAATATRIDEARKLTAQLQYWYRLERTLKEALEI